MKLIWKISVTCFSIPSSSISLCNNVLINSWISWWIIRDVFIPQASVITLWERIENGSVLIFNISWKMLPRRTPIVLVVSFKIIWREAAKRICNAQLAQQFDSQVSLSLSRCQKNAPNYQENDGYLENCFRLLTMPKVCRWRLLSFFGTDHVTQKL